MVNDVKKFEGFAWVNSKPAYPGSDEMFNQLKKLKHRFYQREFDHMVSQKTYINDIAAKNSKVTPTKKTSRISGWTIFRRDIRAFAEYCIARFIVWLELRRRKKEGQ
jgi:hypothetical protein